MLVAGTYEFAEDMCSDDYQGGSALCIDRPVTIEAEVAGSVVLDAKGARRVIYVAAAVRAELVGLNITGGATEHVSFLTSIYPRVTFGSLHLLPLQVGGGIRIDGSADLTDCNIHDNRAIGTYGVSFLHLA